MLKMVLKSRQNGGVTEEEAAYFQEHPDQIDEISAPMLIQIHYLVWGGVIGFCLVALAKWLAYSHLMSRFSEGLATFCTDVLFEIGVALIGGAITAYLLGVLINQQQTNAANWRAEVREKIAELDRKPTPEEP